MYSRPWTMGKQLAWKEGGLRFHQVCLVYSIGCRSWHPHRMEATTFGRVTKETGLLIFRAVAEPRISSKSAKSREIHKNTRNPAKFARNLTKYMSPQHIWKLSWLLGLFTCCKLANLPWNFVTAASKQHPKTTRRSQIETQVFLAHVDRGHWGWECDSSLFYRLLALREECCVLWRITSYTLISPTKMTIYFGKVRFTNDIAWKTCKMSKVHALSHGITNKPCTSSYYKCIVTTDLKNKL